MKAKLVAALEQKDTLPSAYELFLSNLYFDEDVTPKVDEDTPFMEHLPIKLPYDK